MTDDKAGLNLFKAKPSPETKADATTQAARSIIAAETDLREQKTARLRQARLQVEAADAAAAARKPPAVKAAKGRK